MGSLPAASLRGAMGLLLRTMVLAALLGLDAAGKDLSKQPSFVYPEPDSSYVFNKMDTVMVRYISYRETAELWTFCEPGSNPRLIDVFTVPGFNNTAPVLLNFTSATPCWFMIRTGPDRVEDAKNSAHFNVIGVENKAGRRIWELESDPAESPSGSMTNPPASPTSATPTQQPSRRPSGDDDAGDNNRGRSSSGGGTESTERSENPAPPGDDEGPGGLSAGASAGIGIGTAVGLIAVAGGAFWIWWRRRQRQIGTVAAATAAAATTTTTTTTTTTNTRLDGGGGDLPAETASAPFPKRAELSSVNGPAEMEVSERAVRHELAA